MIRAPHTFSVVMPVYNASLFIDEAIESVRNQTFSDFDMVIVDDGSTDTTPEACKRAAALDDRITYLRQDNAGPGTAMNTGIRATSGRWIVVMHGDDVMLPNRLASLHNAIQDGTSGIGILTASVELISETGRGLGRAGPQLPSNPYFLAENESDHIVGGLYHTAILRESLEATGGYNPECTYNEDVELYNRIVEKGYGIQVIPSTLMKYRIHGGAASAAKARKLLLHWRFLKDSIRCRRRGRKCATWEEFLAARKRLPFWTLINDWRKDTAKIHYRRAASALSSGRRIAFASNAVCSAALQPSFILGRWASRRG